MMSNSVSMMATSRDEVDGVLKVLEGTPPADLHGVFFVSYPVGSVNSGGLPFPATQPDGTPNPEYGSPIMNGDGMVLKVDFGQPTVPKYRTRLMKTPCWWADYQSRVGQPDHAPWGFANFGISRISPLLGARNLLNTAIQPVKFSEDGAPFLMATYDVGRAYLLDPDSLELVSSLGTTADWKNAQPAELPWPFGIEQTTAHPQFDALTREWFSVSYQRSATSMVLKPATLAAVSVGHPTFRDRLDTLAQEWHQTRKNEGFLERLGDLFRGLEGEYGPGTAPDSPVNLNLIRWKGGDELEQWTVVDQDGVALDIAECMHQTGVTKDYLVLTDCSFKFKLDLLVNNPFPDLPLVDEFLRHILSGPMVPSTATYLVARRDLTPGGGVVHATRLVRPLPLETIHYSCDYENPNGRITLYGIHNAATCVAEWIRPYDRNQLTGNPVDPQFVGLFAIGSMDVSRVGKWVIDAPAADWVESKVYAEVGGPGADPGPNSWGAGLYTFRDLLSPDRMPEPLEHLWFLSYGTDSRMLTEFIYHLYDDYPNRLVPVDDVVAATRRSLPFGLVRLDTATMSATDWYCCPPDVYLRGLHFVPRTVATAGVARQLDGYLVCPVQAITVPGEPEQGFHSEFWVFDAADVASGPLCRWGDPGLQFAFTLHTAWMESAPPYTGRYRVDPVADYRQTIASLKLDLDKAALNAFFEKNVYPYLETPR